MNKTLAAALVATGMAVGAAGGGVAARDLKGHAFIHFTQALPDGGVRDLGRTGCYDLDSSVKATVESCGPRK